MNRTEPAVVFVAPGDLHLTEADRDNHRAALWMVDEVNRRVRPDFVQFVGDNVQNARAEEFRLFRDLCSRLEVPYRALAGDHDVHEDAAAAGFRRFVGPVCGADALHGFRFLRLCTVEHRPVGLGPAQVEWLRGEVDGALARGERVVLFQHHYPYKVWEQYDGPGIDAWREVVQTRRVEAIFTGHTHYGQTANDGRNVSIATRSVGDPEGGPPGYTLAHLQGDDLAVTYRSVEDRGPLALIVHPRELLLATGPRHVVRGPDHVLVRSWPALETGRAVARVDDGEPFELRPLGGGLWGHPLRGERLAKGIHTLEARVSDAEGAEGTNRIRFVVDPTGRYTPIPAVHPVVTGTAFC